MKPTSEVLKALIAEKIGGRVSTEHTPSEHFYGFEGVVYPSVSSKISIIKSFDDIPPEIIKDAGHVGTLAHDAAERYFLQWLQSGLKPSTTVQDHIVDDMGDVRVISACRALQGFVDGFNIEPIAVELRLASHTLKLAGCADFVGLANAAHGMGDLILVDWKTSSKIDECHMIQLVAYAHMIKELSGITFKSLLLVQLSKKDGGYKVFRTPVREARAAFNALMSLDARLIKLKSKL